MGDDHPERGDQDQPQPDGWGLVMPFVVASSQGGPYDDDALAAGWEGGRLDATLQVGAQLGCRELGGTVRTAMLPQLGLAAMNRGYTMHATPVEATEDHPAMPEWSYVTFTLVDA